MGDMPEFPVLPDYMKFESDPVSASMVALKTGVLNITVEFPVVPDMDIEAVAADFTRWLADFDQRLRPFFEQALPDDLSFEIVADLVGYEIEGFDA